MSILTDLETAWAAVDAARKTLAKPLPISEVAYLEREEALYSALGTYHRLLTDDTIRALLDVAGEVARRAPFLVADPENDRLLNLAAALTRAPLVKEGTTE